MAMSKPNHFGTELDGTKNQDFCCFCYKHGKFVDEGITLDEKADKLIKMGVKNFGMSQENAKKMAYDTLPKLKRWKK